MADRMVDQTSGDKIIPYKPVVIWIHWISAVLVLTQIVVGLFYDDLPKGPERTNVLSWHATLGVTILVLTAVRLYFPLKDLPPPYPSFLPKWERAMAVWVERSMYVLLFVLPITGLMHASSTGASVPLKYGFSVPTIPMHGLGEIHAPLATLLIILLCLHIGGAMLHLFKKDGIDRRMMPWLSKKG